MSSARAIVRVDSPSADIPFSAEARIESGTFVLAVSGEADVASAAPERTAPIDAAYAASGVVDVLIDLSGVTFLDSGGLSWLVRVRSAAAARGGSVRLVGAPSRIERLLRISGLLPLFAA